MLYSKPHARSFGIISWIKNVRLRIFQFHRNPGWPLKPFASVSTRIANLKSGPRSLVLFVATLLLLAGLSLLIYRSAKAVILTITGGGALENITLLIFSDSLACMGLVCIILFFFIYYCGSSFGQSRLPKFLQGRPLVTFFLLTPIIALFLTLAPTIITDFIMQYRPPITHDHGQILLPNVKYILAAIWLSCCLGLSMADTVVDRKAVRWWSAFFPFFPSPILWWNFLAGWLPSRWWSIFRPILILSTFVPFLVAFPNYQPIRKIFPRFHSENTSELVSMGFYQIQRVPGKMEAYLAGVNDLAQIRLSQEGQWSVEKSYSFPFTFNEASFDLNKNLAYVYDGQGRELHVFDLKTFSIRESHPIPVDILPAKGEEFKQAFDPERNFLALVDRPGNFATIDLNTFQGHRRMFFFNDGEVESIFFENQSGKLFVLCNLKLYILRMEDMTLENTIPFGGKRASGFLIDRKRNRILICFPMELKIVAYDYDSLKPVAESNAPMAIRFMALDSDRDLLLLSAMTGAHEIRDANTFERIGRQRIISWTHFVEVFPESGEFILLPAHNIIQIWSYCRFSSYFDPGDRLLLAAEHLFHRLSGQKRSQIMAFDPDPMPGGDPQSQKADDTILVIDPNSENVRAARAILATAGYRVLTVGSTKDLLSLNAEGDTLIDLILVDASIRQKQDNILQHIDSFCRSGVPILRTLNPDDSNLSPLESDVTKPFKPRALVESVYKRLREAEAKRMLTLKQTQE